MRVYRFLVLFVVSLVFLFSLSVVSNVEAASIWPTRAATLCWEITTTSGDTVFVKGRSFPIGNSNYLFSGKATFNGKTHDIFNGNAVVVGTNVLVTIHAAGKNSVAFWTWTGYAVLNGTTLNGKSESIEHAYNRDDLSIGTYYRTSNMTKITCP